MSAFKLLNCGRSPRTKEGKLYLCLVECLEASGFHVMQGRLIVGVEKTARTPARKTAKKNSPKK